LIFDFIPAAQKSSLPAGFKETSTVLLSNRSIKMFYLPKNCICRKHPVFPVQSPLPRHCLLLSAAVQKYKISAQPADPENENC
jgi:hypothetical protein